jgi:hypothetical protein
MVKLLINQSGTPKSKPKRILLSWNRLDFPNADHDYIPCQTTLQKRVTANPQ